MARGTCHGRRPSFPPPPVLGRSTLGAADMPIGCALTFVEGERYRERKALSDGKVDVLMRCELLADGCSQTRGRIEAGSAKLQLQRRLALARLALALARFASEKQRLADHGRYHGDLERFCD